MTVLSENKKPLPAENLPEDTDGLPSPPPVGKAVEITPANSQCSSLLPSASTDARSLDDAFAFEGQLCWTDGNYQGFPGWGVFMGTLPEPWGAKQIEAYVN